MQKVLINDKLIYAIRTRREQFISILEKIISQKKTQPHGKLKIVKKDHFIQFYHRKTSTDIQGTYINKKNILLAKKLAQKDYNNKTELILNNQIKVLDKFLSTYNEHELTKNYKKYIPQIQQFIEPVSLTSEDYAKEWQAVTYKGLSFENSTTEYYTLRKERVRSKSEIMIANALFHAKVPYRYEFPIQIKGNHIFHPDFLCLNPHDGNEIIWEHFGLMDDIEYSQNALYKIARYAENGWILGKNLIYTMETTTVPLSTRLIEKLINAHFA